MTKKNGRSSAMSRIANALSAKVTTWPSDQERVEAMRNLYLRVDRDDRLGAAMQAMVTNAVSLSATGERLEGRFIAVVGPSGAGKSTMIREALSDLTGFEAYSELAGTMTPVLSVEAKRPSTSKSLATTILTEMGVPFSRRITARIAWDIVRETLAVRQVILMHIDEAQDCLRDGDEETQLTRDELKSLTQGSWPVSIVLSGLPTLTSFVFGDSQIMRRSTVIDLKPLSRKDDADLVSALLTEMAARARLIVNVPAGYDVVDRLACAGCCHIGRIAKVVMHAAENAMAEGSPYIGIPNLKHALEEITLCDDSRNAFIAEGNYDRIVYWPDDPNGADVRDTVYPSMPDEVMA